MKIVLSFSFPMQMCSSSTRLACLLFFYSDSGRPINNHPLKLPCSSASWKKRASHQTSAQSSPDVIQFELESYNSYGRKRGDFFPLCSVLASWNVAAAAFFSFFDFGAMTCIMCRDMCCSHSAKSTSKNEFFVFWFFCGVSESAKRVDMFGRCKMNWFSMASVVQQLLTITMKVASVKNR